MTTVKDLKAEAKALGLTGYSRLDKEALEKAVAKAKTAPPAPDAEAAAVDETEQLGHENLGAAAPGVPTEPEKANLTDAETKSVGETAKKYGSVGGPIPKNLGVPTEPEKAGNVEPPKPPKPADPKPAPNFTGNPDGIGVPTEPDRGGLNKLERKLSRV